MAKTNPVGENTGNLEILPKHRKFRFAQVVNSLNLTVKDISIFAVKISKKKSLIVTNHVNWHRDILRSDGKKKWKTQGI